MWQINKSLQDWYHNQGFGYLDYRNKIEKPDLLWTEGLCLTEKGKSIFGQRLAKLVKRALN